ncbi:MAG: DUF4397 domain-containing protein [Planctomycetota bacterium]
MLHPTLLTARTPRVAFASDALTHHTHAMKTFTSLLLASALATGAAGQDVKLSVIHGIPGLPSAVEVFANNNRLFAFDFGTSQGPLSLPPARYAVEVRLQGMPVLTANLDLQAGRNYTAIAHLDASGGNALTLFANDISSIVAGNARVVVRHTAAAPVVDVELRRNGSLTARLTNLSNGAGQQGDVPGGAYTAAIFPAGGMTPVLGPASVDLPSGVVTIVYAVGSLAGSSLELFTQHIDLNPPKAALEVIHGIPGLPAPAEVFVDNASLFSFDFSDRRGPFALAPQTYGIDVRVQSQTVLSARPTLAPAARYVAIAHLREGGGIALALFASSATAPAAGNARVTVRHLADAPAVDVAVEQGGRRIATLTGLRNPNETSAELPGGTYDVSVFAAGTTNRVLGPVSLDLEAGVAYGVNAVGALSGSTLGLVLERVNFNPRSIALGAIGTSCGGTLSASTDRPDFGNTFRLRLAGAQPNGMAMLLVGRSNTSIGGLALPLDLRPYGAAGCTLYTSADFVMPIAVDASGSAFMPVSVPMNMARQAAYVQFASSTNQNALGAVFTGALGLGVR